MRILSVCRSGGEYGPEHVAELRAQCARWAPGVPFACLSDIPGIPGRIPLRHDWPGWWAKMELFRLDGPALYFDLDTVIIGDLGAFIAQAKGAAFTIMRDVYRPKRVQSSVMAWSGNMAWLSERFARDPHRYMAENSTPEHWGDQGFIGRHISGHELWQDEIPGALVSWKRDCRDGVPVGACVVVFHGRPRPWEVEDKWRHMTI